MRLVNKAFDEFRAYRILGTFAKNVAQRIKGYLKANKIYRQQTRRVFL